MTLVILVGVGIRLPAGCTNDCSCTVIRPDEVAAMACIWPSTQAVAAPIPRTGSVWLDSVCLVPNCVRRRMVAWIRRGSTSRSMARRSGSNPREVTAKPASAVAALAGVVRVSMGAAAAVTAEADRNARRVEPLGPKTCLFSIARTNMTDSHQSQADPDNGYISVQRRAAGQLATGGNNGSAYHPRHLFPLLAARSSQRPSGTLGKARGRVGLGETWQEPATVDSPGCIPRTGTQPRTKPCRRMRPS